MAKLSDNAKKALVAAALGGAVLSQLFGGGGEEPKPCEGKDCQLVEMVDSADYIQLKRDIADKVLSNTPLSWDEYQLYLVMVDEELRGGKNIGAVNENDDLKTNLTNLLYE